MNFYIQCMNQIITLKTKNTRLSEQSINRRKRCEIDTPNTYTWPLTPNTYTWPLTPNTYTWLFSFLEKMAEYCNDFKVFVLFHDRSTSKMKRRALQTVFFFNDRKKKQSAKFFFVLKRVPLSWNHTFIFMKLKNYVD